MPDTASDEKRSVPDVTETSPVPDPQDGTGRDHATQPVEGLQSPAAEGRTVRSSGRFWLGIVVGAIVSAPLAWLLAYAATLPFFLGLFFYALFGLIIGAAVHRVASPGRPYAKPVVIVGSTALIVGAWMVSIVVEAQGLPTDLAEDVPNKTLDLRGRTRAEYVDFVASGIRSYMNEHYAPGGTVGYVRWVLTSGEFPKGSIEGVNRTLRFPQRKGWWMMRVVLSIGLFAFGVSSQTFLLRLPRDPAAVIAREPDEVDPQEPS